MSIISNYGPEISPIWILLDEPYSNDADSGVILGGGYGYNFRKIWKMGGMATSDIHIRSLRPCLGATYIKENVLSSLVADIDKNHPTIIVPLSDEILNYLVPHTTQAKEKNSSLGKWAGSLLQSKYLSYPHYIIGSLPPEQVTRQWDYSEIQAFIDFGHVREEFEYWKQYGTLNPLPVRHLLCEPIYPDLIAYLNDCLNLSYVGSDIETIRPRKGSFYHGQNCGYPYVASLAKSKSDAVSFSLWDYTPEQCIVIWRLLDKIYSTIPQVGQNYFLFDSHYLEAMGWHVCLDKCKDTLIRHHVLWPSLKHALHFQTRQYTREVYYKDDGRNFNVKRKKQFMEYNAKDSCVTVEIFEEQEKEFNERPHLI
jgi:hypothetical protein